jgi:hypothetical protein
VEDDFLSRRDGSRLLFGHDYSSKNRRFAGGLVPPLA